MQIITAVLALLIVFLILRQAELYVPRILDDDWVSTRNDPERNGGPFDMCSPESFGDCDRIKFPNLSRY
jgi:hypothetical protein